MAAQEKVYYATGRRKTSAARIFLKPGSGKIKINGKEGDVYLQTPINRVKVLQPFTVTETKNKFDLFITCLLYTSPSPRDATLSRMPSSA